MGGGRARRPSAVVVLTVDYGRPPWIALGLAGSFATYGLLKKQVGPRVGALQSLTVETAVLALPALGFLVALEVRGDGQLGHSGVGSRAAARVRRAWSPRYRCSSSRRPRGGSR